MSRANAISSTSIEGSFYLVTLSPADERDITMSVSASQYVCIYVSVYLSVDAHVGLSHKQHVCTSSTFLSLLPVTVARCSSSDNAMRRRTSGFMDDVMFSHDGRREWRKMRRVFKVTQ